MSDAPQHTNAQPIVDPAYAEIEDRLRSFLTGLSGAADGELTDDRELLDSGLVASLQVLEIVDFLEDAMDVALSPTEVSPERFRSIAALAKLVREKRGTTP